MEILLIDACPRSQSRTRALAMEVLNHLQGHITTIKLSEANLPVIDEAAVNKRTEDIKAGRFDDPVYDYAKQFAAADAIVIAAPFWDLSFPAVLKKYIEAITVSGITFRYSEEGIPIGLSKAENLYYVTTAGGPIFNEDFGYGYIKAMTTLMYGVRRCFCFKAENLDVYGVDVEAVMQKAMEDISVHFQNKQSRE